MRPATLFKASIQIKEGRDPVISLQELLDTFYSTRSPREKLAVIEREPLLLNMGILDAYIGGAAEYLARQYSLPSIPDWVFLSQRYLAEPSFTSVSQDAAMKEYLSFTSPAEFRSRNIFTEDRPLRRARTPLSPTSDQTQNPAPSMP